jgi:hypothetical protein
LFEFPNFKGPIHHIATNKSSLWIPKFEALFEQAGVGLNWKFNKVRVDGHFGPHGGGYHQWVYNTLSTAIDGKSGAFAQLALQKALIRTGNFLQANPHYVSGKFIGPIPHP